MYLTIAIAIYNGEKYIDRCLKSIMESLNNYNGDKEIEVLAINDGSKDNSLELLNNYKEKIYNFIVFNKDNGGVSSARNKALELARGEYLWFIDIDDEIDSNYFIYILENLSVDISIFNYYEISHNKKYLRTEVSNTNNITSIDSDKNILLLSPAPWRYIFKKEFLKSTGLKFLSGCLYEDLNLTLKLLLEASSISSFNIPIYKYYINENSIMTSKNIERKGDILIVVDDIIKYYKEKNVFEKYYEELEYIAIHNILYVTYVSVIQVDKNNVLLDKLIDFVNNNYPNWMNNSYLAQENIIKRRVLKNMYSNKKNVVMLLLKIKNYLRKFI